jgi:hypothetical protein
LRRMPKVWTGIDEEDKGEEMEDRRWYVGA